MNETGFFAIVILFLICVSGVNAAEFLEYHEEFNDGNILSRGWHWEWGTPSWNVTNGELNWQQSNLTIWQEYNRNLPMLLRDAPKLSEGLATEVTVRMSDIGDGGSQVGIFWYYNRQNYYKIVVENLTSMGLNVVFLREEADGTHTMHNQIPMHDIHDLRIAVEGDEVRGYYRQHGETAWQSAGAFPLNVKNLPLQVGLSTHHGGAWVQADDFKIFSQRPVKPVAVFDAWTDDNPKGRNGVAPLIVHCDAQMSAGTGLSYSWDFGDGGTSTFPAPSHTYTLPGTYTITLTAGNGAGSDTFTERVHVVPGSDDSNLIVDIRGDDLTGITVHDDSRYDNWGVLNKGVLQVPGYNGKALRFNGEHSNVIVSISPELRLGYAAFSISGWVRWGGAPGSGGGRILTKTHYTSEEMFSLYVHDDRKLRFLVKTSNGTLILTSSASIPDDGQFHHVAAVYDKSISQMRTYIDGVLRGTKTQSGSVINNNRPLQLGANLNVPDSGFNGDLDTVQLYKRALSSAEIAAMADTQSGQAPNASFTAVCTYLDVSGDAGSSIDSDGTIESYEWDFGDGSNATGETAGHTYASPGTYVITLTLTDNDGLSSSAAQSVTATLPPDPIEMTVYQAEDNTDSSDSKYRTDGSWWTGTGFQDMFRSSVSYVEWNCVYRENTEPVHLQLIYTNGDEVDRSCSVSVNGISAGTVAFAPTGGWSTVGIESIDVNLQSGFNTIRIQGANPEGGPDFDRMEISSNNNPVNEAPVVDAGADRDAVPGSVITLNGTVTDDGLPGTGLTCGWTQVSGSGTAVFTYPDSRNTDVSFDLEGTYVLRLTADDSLLSSYDEIIVEVAIPTAVAVYQAEDYTDKSDSYDRTDGDWWTGTGFQDMFRSPASFIEWDDVYSDTAGTATLRFIFTNGSSYDRTCSIIINGSTVGTVPFSPTGSWSKVGVEIADVNLESGFNTVRIQGANPEGGPDFDRMEVGTAPVAILVYQAEDYTDKSDSYDRTDGDWWTGTGFQDMFRSPDSYVEWNNVYAENPGTVTLRLIYTNGHTYDRTCSVILNGTVIAAAAFSPTGSWSTAGTEFISADLEGGYNTIRIQGANPEGGPDFDRMEIITDSAGSSLFFETGDTSSSGNPSESDKNTAAAAAGMSAGGGCTPISGNGQGSLLFTLLLVVAAGMFRIRRSADSGNPAHAVRRFGGAGLKHRNTEPE